MDRYDGSLDASKRVGSGQVLQGTGEPQEALEIVMMIACPRGQGAPRLPKIGRRDGQQRDRRCMPHSQDPEAWTIPSMNEVPTWPVALLIRGWGDGREDRN